MSSTEACRVSITQYVCAVNLLIAIRGAYGVVHSNGYVDSVVIGDTGPTVSRLFYMEQRRPVDGADPNTYNPDDRGRLIV